MSPLIKWLLSHLDLVTVSKEWEIHKPNGRTGRDFNSDKNSQHNIYASMSVFVTNDL